QIAPLQWPSSAGLLFFSTRVQLSSAREYLWLCPPAATGIRGHSSTRIAGQDASGSRHDARGESAVRFDTARPWQPAYPSSPALAADPQNEDWKSILFQRSDHS